MLPGSRGPRGDEWVAIVALGVVFWVVIAALALVGAWLAAFWMRLLGGDLLPPHGGACGPEAGRRVEGEGVGVVLDDPAGAGEAAARGVPGDPFEVVPALADMPAG